LLTFNESAKAAHGHAGEFANNENRHQEHEQQLKRENRNFSE